MVLKLADEGFRVPSVSAKDADKIAEQLLKSSSETKKTCLNLLLVNLLKGWVVVSKLTAVIWSRLELIWKNLFRLPTSPCFQTYEIDKNTKDELSGGMKDDSEGWLAVVGRGSLTHIGNMI